MILAGRVWFLGSVGQMRTRLQEMLRSLVVPWCVNHFWTPRNWSCSPLGTRLVHILSSLTHSHLELSFTVPSIVPSIAVPQQFLLFADPTPALSWAPLMADLTYHPPMLVLPCLASPFPQQPPSLLTQTSRSIFFTCTTPAHPQSWDPPFVN